MKELTLERDLAVWCGNVSGVIAYGQKRDEVYAVACRIREVGETDADDIANHLLITDNPTGKSIAERLLHICEALSVVQPSRGGYELTEEGERVAASQQVLVPEKGAWRIWASRDPLLQAPVLEVERFEDPSAFDEIRGKERDRERTMRDTPHWLREFTGQPFDITASATPTRIDDLERIAEPVEPDASLRLKWNVSQGELRLVGRLGKREVDTELDAPRKTLRELRRDLLEGAGLWRYWDDERGELLVFFDDASEVERRSMVRSVGISPHIPEVGKFDPLTVDLRMNAATPDDAQWWAQWRLLNAIDDYATTACYGEWARKAAAPFEHYDVQMPTRHDLSAMPASDTPNWHLVAAEDWRL